MSAPQPCGTYAAYRRHIRLREAPDGRCREANAEYMRARRAARPDTVALEQDRNAARDRALRRLAAEHPDQFRSMLAEEYERRGIQP